MSDVRALHLHTVDTLCTDLICGLSIGIGTKGETFVLGDTAARSILNWYRQNRARWARNVSSPDVDLIVNAALQAPPNLSTTSIAKTNQKRVLNLCRVEAHRFGGLHAYNDEGKAPESFVLEISKPITLLEGWNGSGKTSIANAAIWCLTGQLLRPQRKPEQADAEYECRVDLPNSTEIVGYKLTPVTPLPNGRHFPRTSDQRIPLDTWVELTFVDEEDKAISRVRRTQSRTARGVVTETLVGLDELGIHPISAQIGTTIPGLLPFIQIGGVSEFGQAITELTGLSELVDLARHATRVQQRIDVEFRRARRRTNAIEHRSVQTLARRLLRPQGSAPAIALAAQTPDPRKSPPTVLADPSEVEVHRVVGVLFDDVSPPISRQEAVAVDQAPAIKSIETAYRVRDDSALPLALPGQIVLGGKRILPNEFDSYQGRLVALTMLDGLSIFKRVGLKLPGSMGFLRQFESIGGLGSSEIVAVEEVDGAPNVRVMMHARLVLGVLYE